MAGECLRSIQKVHTLSNRYILERVPDLRQKLIVAPVQVLVVDGTATIEVAVVVITRVSDVLRIRQRGRGGGLAGSADSFC